MAEAGQHTDQSAGPARAGLLQPADLGHEHGDDDHEGPAEDVLQP